MRWRLRVVVPAVGLALVVNGVGLYLLVRINAHVRPPEKKQRAAARQINFVQQRKKRPRRPVQTRVKQVALRQPPLPVPNLPAAIQAPGLVLPEVEAASLIQPVFDKEVRRNTRLVLSEEEVDERPRVEQRVSPDYPEDAADRGIAGWVQVKLLIDRQGRVQQIQVLGGSPPGVFEEAAKRAVKRWVFSPARYQGQTVSVWFKQRVIFRLE